MMSLDLVEKVASEIVVSDEAGLSGEGSFRDCCEGSFSDEPGHSGEGSSNVMTGTERIWNLNRIGSLMLRLGNWFRNLWR